MITLLQRVSEARVEVDAISIGSITQGLLVLVGVEADDDESTARGFVDRLLNYRVFADSDGKMNQSLKDIGGQAIFDAMVAYARSVYESIACGQFGADMQVHLVNDGPVTFILD